MKKIIQLGFVSIILLLVLLAVAGLFYIKSTHEAVLQVVKSSDVKIENALAMRNAARARLSNLLEINIIKDPFELDDEISDFYKNAYPYRIARDALFSTIITDEERSLHKLMDKQAGVSLPISHKIVQTYENDLSKESVGMLLVDIREAQNNLIDTIELFVELQKKQRAVAYSLSHKKFHDGFIWLSLVGLVAILVTIFISRYVVSYVARNHEELHLANDGMEKAIIKAEEETALKSEFLATMSHEIRTPLTAIIGFAETVLFSNQSMGQRLNSIQTIIRSGKHLLQIVNDILDLSKVEANKLEIEYKDSFLFEMLDDFEYLEQKQAEAKNLTFSVDYIYPLPNKIQIDELRVKQILYNLLNNAVKFTDTGSVGLKVYFRESDKTLHFEVSDSGVGISTEQQELIFQPYRQADCSTTRKFGGTGLGLTLSKLLAERMGGSLSVESELGKGSTFELYFPCDVSVDSEMLMTKDITLSTSTNPVERVENNELSGRVLFAEDNIDNQELFAILLEKMGIDVTFVDNGKLAVEAVKDNNFDLILMDMRMPVMGGIEAVKILRQQGFTKPIIAVTANAMQEDKDESFEAGCNEFLTKPINTKLLTETLGKYLDLNVSESGSDDSKPENKKSKTHSHITSSLLSDDPDMIGLVKRFVKRLPEMIVEIEKLIEEKSWLELSSALHQLKGTGGNYGYEIIFTIAGKMEFQSANKNIDEIDSLFSELKENYEKILLGVEES